MSDVTCPECGQITSLPGIRRSYDEFCSHCDFPLFWAPSAIPLVTASAGSDTTLRRLPGTGGRQTVGTMACPTCGELNSLSAVVCIRCGNDMHPKLLVIVQAPVPEPLPPPALVVMKRPWWPWVLLAVLSIAVIVTVVIIENR